MTKYQLIFRYLLHCFFINTSPLLPVFFLLLFALSQLSMSCSSSRCFDGFQWFDFIWFYISINRVSHYSSLVCPSSSNVNGKESWPTSLSFSFLKLNHNSLILSDNLNSVTILLICADKFGSPTSGVRDW